MYYAGRPHMAHHVPALPEILDVLEKRYGPQEPCWPTDPYQFLVWWYCGYPASDLACSKGWDCLTREIGFETGQILSASPQALAKALKQGGMVPELRALRLKELAARVKDSYGDNLRTALVGPLAEVRKILKTFHSISDPGADRILLFAGIAPLPAVASNCPYVLVRIQRGRERENYGVTYKEARDAVASETPEKFDARIRAYLLLKRHGQELCKRTNPKCGECPLSSRCAFFAGNNRGRSARAGNPRRG